MKKSINFNPLLLLILVLTTNLSFSQSSLISFSFEGTVYIGEDPVEGVEVRVFENNELISTVYSDKKGKFEMDLMKGSEYIVEMSLAGYYPKRMIFRTNVEEGVKKLPKFKFDVALIDEEKYSKTEEENPGQTSILDFPSAIIEYSKALSDFDYRSEYHEHIKEQLDKIEEN